MPCRPNPDLLMHQAMLESECAVLLEENAQLTKQLRKVEAAREEVMDCATEMLLEKVTKKQHPSFD